MASSTGEKGKEKSNLVDGAAGVEQITMSGVVKVEPEVLKDIARKNEQLVKRCMTLLDDLEEKVRYARNYWSGEAADLYQSVFLKQKEACSEHLTVLGSYPENLLKMAGIYEEVIREASSEIDSIHDFNLQ